MPARATAPFLIDVSAGRRMSILLRAVILPLLAVVAALWVLGSIYPNAAYIRADHRFCPADGKADWLQTERCYRETSLAPGSAGVVMKSQMYPPDKIPPAEFRARMFYFATVLFMLAILTFVPWYALRMVREVDKNLLWTALACVCGAGAFIVLLVAIDHSWLRSVHSRDLMRPILKLMPAPFVALPEQDAPIATTWGVVVAIRNIGHVLTAVAFTACAALAACCWLTCPKPETARRLAQTNTLPRLVPGIARTVSRLRLALYLMALLMGFTIVYTHAVLNWPLSVFKAESEAAKHGKALVDALVLYWSVAFTAAIAVVYVPIAYVTAHRVEAVIVLETENLSHADALAWPAKNGLVFSITTEAKALLAMFVPIIAGVAGASIKGLIGG